MFVKALLQVGARLQAEGRGDEEAEVFLKLGARLKDEKKSTQAIEALSIVTKIAKSENAKKSHGSVAYYNLGNIHRVAHAYDKAHVCFGIASKLNIGYNEARYMQAHCLVKLGEIDAGIKVEMTNTAIPFSRIDRYVQLPPNAPNNGVDAESLRRFLAIFNYSDTVPRDEVTSRHEQWGRDVRAAVGKMRKHHAKGKEPDRPLRIGYISPDLRAHVVARFFAPALRFRTREQFHVTCYYTGRKPPDAMSAALREMSDAWKSLSGKQAREVGGERRESM
jgi:protein O-GlcNAc transferase